MASYDSDGKLHSKSIYKYDSNGNKAEESSYDSDGKLKRKYISTYDSNENEIESSIYDYFADRSWEWKQISTYNTNNRIIEKIMHHLKSKFGELQQTPTKKTTYEYEEY